MSQDSNDLLNQITENLPEDKKAAFFSEYDKVKKDRAIALLLDFFLGGFGAHKFYLGKTGQGFLYLLFCWTGVPVFIAFIELFTLSKQVKTYNEQKAREVVALLLINVGDSQGPSLSEIKIEGFE